MNMQRWDDLLRRKDLSGLYSSLQDVEVPVEDRLQYINHSHKDDTLVKDLTLVEVCLFHNDTISLHLDSFLELLDEKDRLPALMRRHSTKFKREVGETVEEMQGEESVFGNLVYCGTAAQVSSVLSLLSEDEQWQLLSSECYSCPDGDAATPIFVRVRGSRRNPDSDVEVTSALLDTAIGLGRLYDVLCISKRKMCFDGEKLGAASPRNVLIETARDGEKGVDIIRLILEKARQADILEEYLEQKDESGHSALSLAMKYGRVAVVKEILAISRQSDSDRLCNLNSPSDRRAPLKYIDKLIERPPSAKRLPEYQLIRTMLQSYQEEFLRTRRRLSGEGELSVIFSRSSAEHASDHEAASSAP